MRMIKMPSKVDVTQEIEQRAQQAAQAGADHWALCSISCVQIWRRTRYIGDIVAAAWTSLAGY